MSMYSAITAPSTSARRLSLGADLAEQVELAGAEQAGEVAQAVADAVIGSEVALMRAEATETAEAEAAATGTAEKKS